MIDQARHPGPRPSSAARLVAGVLVPILLLAASYALWALSDRLLTIGPFDRAAFGWIVVVPVWIAAPVVSGFVWRSFPRLVARGLAIAVGVVVTTVATILLWRAVAFPTCQFGPNRTPAELLAPALTTGLAIGAGVAISALVAERFARRQQPVRAAAAAAATQIAMVFVAILVAAGDLLAPVCQRPS